MSNHHDRMTQDQYLALARLTSPGEMAATNPLMSRNEAAAMIDRIKAGKETTKLERLRAALTKINLRRLQPSREPASAALAVQPTESDRSTVPPPQHRCNISIAKPPAAPAAQPKEFEPLTYAQKRELHRILMPQDLGCVERMSKQEAWLAIKLWHQGCYMYLPDPLRPKR